MEPIRQGPVAKCCNLKSHQNIGFSSLFALDLYRTSVLITTIPPFARASLLSLSLLLHGPRTLMCLGWNPDSRPRLDRMSYAGDGGELLIRGGAEYLWMSSL